MRQKELELLYAYFTNYLTILDGEVITRQNNIRYREPNMADCLELMLATERRNNFLEFSRDVMSLLNMRTCEIEKEECL